MKRLFPLILISLSVFAAGCGGSLGAAPPYEDEQLNLQNQVFGAVWHSELGSELINVSDGSLVLANDGLIHSAAVFVPFADDGSSYVHGVFTVEIPDRSDAKLQSYVGFPAGFAGAALVQVYIQDGESFPLLSEMTVGTNGPLALVEADLSAYRGQNRMIILSASALPGQDRHSGILWIDTILSNP